MGAAALIEEGWRHLPAYDGVPRDFLSEEVQRETRVAAHLLEAALTLHPGHLRALWSLGHAEFLLAEDRRNRGGSEEAAAHYERAVAALTRAIELNPHDPWAFYARGAARTSFGNHAEAWKDLEEAVETAGAILARPGDHGLLAWLRFKAMELLPEVLMRLGEFDEARAALRELHGESSGEWSLLMALGESHLRQRDFAGAREVYVETREKFPDDFTSCALLGYLEGLLGNHEAAVSHLADALARELKPGMSTRRWLWILSTDESEASAREELTGFFEQPPDNVSEWDLTLGRFVVGEGEVEAFLDAARIEEQRRMDAGETLDQRMCEVWFYAGLRWELDAAETADDATRKALLARAREAHSTALGYEPSKWTWEREYAAVHLAALQAEGE